MFPKSKPLEQKNVRAVLVFIVFIVISFGLLLSVAQRLLYGRLARHRICFLLSSAAVSAASAMRRTASATAARIGFDDALGDKRALKNIVLLGKLQFCKAV